MESSSELSISEVGRAMIRRKVEFFALFLIVFSIAVLGIFAAPWIYRAETKIIVQNESNLYAPGLLPQTLDDKAFLASQAEIISSRSVIEKSLSQMHDKGLLNKFSYQDIRKKINIGYLNESNVLEVSVSLQNQKEAIELANAIVNNFIVYGSGLKLSSVSSNLKALNNKIVLVKEDLDKIKVFLKELSGKDKLEFYQAQTPLYVNYLIELDKNNLESKKYAARLKEELAKTNDVLKKGESLFRYPLLPSFSGKENGENPTLSLTSIPWIQDIRSRIQEAEAHLSRLRVEYTDNNPEVIGVNEQITLLKNNLRSELEKIMFVYADYYRDYIGYLGVQESSNKAEKSVYKEDLNKISAYIDEAAVKQIEYSILSKTYEASQDIYALFLKKQNELELIRDKFLDSQLPNIQILESAYPPLKRVSPNIPLNIFLGVFFGMFVGICGVLSSERKVNSQERRSMPRVKGIYAVGYEFTSDKVTQKHYSIIEDISGSGIAVRSRDRLKEGSQYSLAIYLNEKEFIHVSAEVVCVRDSAIKDMYVVGFKFSKIDLPDQEKLLKYIYGQNVRSRDNEYIPS
ncbi:MAG: PilZ domain-containing protein [Candidatus Omnitrophota bacterium]